MFDNDIIIYPRSDFLILQNPESSEKSSLPSVTLCCRAPVDIITLS